MAKSGNWGRSFLQKQTGILETKLNECLEQQTRARGYLADIEKDGLNDPADKANAVLNQELNLRQASGCAEQIFKVSRAIIAIKKGGYGICDDCGEKISRKRLEAAPWATRCTSCQQVEESHGR